MMFVALRPSRSAALACCCSSAGTVCGTIPELAGKKNADDAAVQQREQRELPDPRVAGQQQRRDDRLASRR